MRELEQIRQQINGIDEKLVPLLEERLHASADVADYKKAHDMEIFQPERERAVIERAVGMLKDKGLSRAVADIVASVMDVGKLCQLSRIYEGGDELEREPFDRGAKVAYQGVPGAFSAQAAESYFGSLNNASAYPTFGAVIDAIDCGEVKYGVLPLENSTIGSVVEVYDLLAARSMYIVGEIWQPIRHALVGVRGARLDDVRRVVSKAEALGQCAEFLERGGWEQSPYANTAAAAKSVAESGDKSVAAIASESAAKLYGLDVLACPVNDVKDNYTRFIIVSARLTDREADKVSVSFVVDNECGTLHRVLGMFARLGVNMSKIESRPDKKNPAKYYFVADLEGSCKGKEMRLALAAAKTMTHDFKLLGEYRKGSI